MALFPLSGVLRGFSGCDVQQYVSPQTLVRPCLTKKLLISESDTFCAGLIFTPAGRFNLRNAADLNDQNFRTLWVSG